MLQLPVFFQLGLGFEERFTVRKLAGKIVLDAVIRYDAIMRLFHMIFSAFPGLAHLSTHFAS